MWIEGTCNFASVSRKCFNAVFGDMPAHGCSPTAKVEKYLSHRTCTGHISGIVPQQHFLRNKLPPGRFFLDFRRKQSVLSSWHKRNKTEVGCNQGRTCLPPRTRSTARYTRHTRPSASVELLMASAGGRCKKSAIAFHISRSHRPC